MSKDKAEYYIIERENSSNYPLLIEDDGCPFYIKKKEYIEDAEHMFFCLGAPIPRKPEMVDYHPVPYTVVSKKIYDILEPMKIKGIQLIPATITGKDNELYEDYFYLHIYNIYDFLDKDLSIYDWDDFINQAEDIEKIVISKDIKNIPIEQRLIFKLKEDPTFELYHQTIVDKIMESSPKGLRFINVEEWNLINDYNTHTNE